MHVSWAFSIYSGRKLADLLSFIVEGQVVPKGRPRVVIRGQKVHAITPKSTRAYETRLRYEMMAVVSRKDWVNTGVFAVRLHIHSTSKRRRDADNLLKTVLDAGNGILWADDSLVTETHVYLVPSDRDMLIVDVARLDEVPTSPLGLRPGMTIR